MRGERIILCLGCGQQNRPRSDARLDLVKCARCSQPLGQARARPGLDRRKLLALLLVGGLVGYLVYKHKSSLPQSPASAASTHERIISPDELFGRPIDRVPNTYKHTAQEGTSTSGETPAPEIGGTPLPTLKPALPVPISTGLVWARPGRERIAPLEIRTPSAYNYFITLVDVTDEAEEVTVYIEGGRTFTADVPLGTYELYYDSGKIWYGEDQLFGPDTASFRAEKQFTFNLEGNSVSGYTIELVLQVGGNLSVTRIDPSQRRRLRRAG